MIVDMCCILLLVSSLIITVGVGLSCIEDVPVDVVNSVVDGGLSYIIVGVLVGIISFFGGGLSCTVNVSVSVVHSFVGGGLSCMVGALVGVISFVVSGGLFCTVDVSASVINSVGGGLSCIVDIPVSVINSVGIDGFSFIIKVPLCSVGVGERWNFIVSDGYSFTVDVLKSAVVVTLVSVSITIIRYELG